MFIKSKEKTKTLINALKMYVMCIPEMEGKVAVDHFSMPFSDYDIIEAIFTDFLKEFNLLEIGDKLKEEYIKNYFAIEDEIEKENYRNYTINLIEEVIQNRGVV